MLKKAKEIIQQEKDGVITRNQKIELLINLNYYNWDNN